MTTQEILQGVHDWTNGKIVYDISVAHPDGQGNPTPYADLTAALGTNGANIPEAIRKGGMSVKYVQTSDNKYVHFMYLGTSTADADIANVFNWEKAGKEIAELEVDGVFLTVAKARTYYGNAAIGKVVAVCDDGKVYKITSASVTSLEGDLQNENIRYIYEGWILKYDSVNNLIVPSNLDAEHTEEVNMSFVAGNAFATESGDTTIDMTTPISTSTRQCGILKTKEGEQYIINSSSSERIRCFIFVNENGLILSYAETLQSYYQRIVAPSDAAYLITNLWKDGQTGVTYQSIGAERIYRVVSDEELERRKACVSNDYVNVGDEYFKNAFGVKLNNVLTINTTSGQSSSFLSYVIPVVEGDCFKITGRGGATYSLWGFIDNNGYMIAKSGVTTYVENEYIDTPEVASYLVVNVDRTLPYSVQRNVKEIVASVSSVIQNKHLEWTNGDLANNSQCDVFTVAVPDLSYALKYTNAAYTGAQLRGMCFYDENDEPILNSGKRCCNSSGTYYIEESVPVPINAKYARFTWPHLLNANDFKASFKTDELEHRLDMMLDMMLDDTTTDVLNNVKMMADSEMFRLESNWWIENNFLNSQYESSENTAVEAFLNKIESRAGSGIYQIAVISDTHGSGAYTWKNITRSTPEVCHRSIAVFNKVVKHCDAALHGGDISCDYGTSRLRDMQYMYEIIRKFCFNKPFFITKGNHDENNNTYVEADMLNLDWVNNIYYKRNFSTFTTVTESTWDGSPLYVSRTELVSDREFKNIIQHWLSPSGAVWGNGAYYYYDIDSVKIRFIVANSFPVNDNHVVSEDEEYLWLAQTALNFSEKGTPSDWKVLMLRHTQSTGLTELSNCINAFRNGSSWTYGTTTINFGNLNGGGMTFIAHIHGHEHENLFSNGAGYLDIGENAAFVPISSLGNASLYGISVLSIDTVNSKVYEDTIKGKSWCYNYSTNKAEIGVGDTITVATSGITGASITITSSDTSIASVNNKVVTGVSAGDAIISVSNGTTTWQYPIVVV